MLQAPTLPPSAIDQWNKRLACLRDGENDGEIWNLRERFGAPMIQVLQQNPELDGLVGDEYEQVYRAEFSATDTTKGWVYDKGGPYLCPEMEGYMVSALQNNHCVMIPVREGAQTVWAYKHAIPHDSAAEHYGDRDVMLNLATMEAFTPGPAVRRWLAPIALGYSEEPKIVTPGELKAALPGPKRNLHISRPVIRAHKHGVKLFDIREQLLAKYLATQKGGL
jgi:hypothetical protein